MPRRPLSERQLDVAIQRNLSRIRYVIARGARRLGIPKPMLIWEHDDERVGYFDQKRWAIVLSSSNVMDKACDLTLGVETAYHELVHAWQIHNLPQFYNKSGVEYHDVVFWLKLFELQPGCTEKPKLDSELLGTRRTLRRKLERLWRRMPIRWRGTPIDDDLNRLWER